MAQPLVFGLERMSPPPYAAQGLLTSQISRISQENSLRTTSSKSIDFWVEFGLNFSIIQYLQSFVKWIHSGKTPLLIEKEALLIAIIIIVAARKFFSHYIIIQFLSLFIPL